jgi:hypothetical protein
MLLLGLVLLGFAWGGARGRRLAAFSTQPSSHGSSALFECHVEFSTGKVLCPSGRGALSGIRVLERGLSSLLDPELTPITERLAPRDSPRQTLPSHAVSAAPHAGFMWALHQQDQVTPLIDIVGSVIESAVEAQEKALGAFLDLACAEQSTLWKSAPLPAAADGICRERRQSSFDCVATASLLSIAGEAMKECLEHLDRLEMELSKLDKTLLRGFSLARVASVAEPSSDAVQQREANGIARALAQRRAEVCTGSLHKDLVGMDVTDGCWAQREEGLDGNWSSVWSAGSRVPLCGCGGFPPLLDAWTGLDPTEAARGARWAVLPPDWPVSADISLDIDASPEDLLTQSPPSRGSVCDAADWLTRSHRLGGFLHGHTRHSMGVLLSACDMMDSFQFGRRILRAAREATSRSSRSLWSVSLELLREFVSDTHRDWFSHVAVDAGEERAPNSSPTRVWQGVEDLDEEWALEQATGDSRPVLEDLGELRCVSVARSALEQWFLMHPMARESAKEVRRLLEFGDGREV